MKPSDFTQLTDTISNSISQTISNTLSSSPLNSLFKKPKNELEGEQQAQGPSVPDDLWIKCPACKTMLLSSDLREDLFVCRKCGHHFKVTARQRIRILTDRHSFHEQDKEMESVNLIDFPGYDKKLENARKNSGEKESVVWGTAEIDGNPCVLCVMDSNFMAGRDANKGACTHPCRWKYAVVEENRPGEYMPVYENERGTYIFNSKDLCMIEHIPELIEAGIDSFKIEGRMKTALYVATVARTYRLAIDDFLKDPELYKSRIPFYKSEISKCTYRQYTTGFFFGKPDENTQIYESNTYIKEYTYLGIVGDMNEEGLYNIEQRNKFSVGEQIEVMKPDGENIQVTVRRITDDKGKDMESCPHPKQQLYIDLGVKLDRYDILRRKED